MTATADHPVSWRAATGAAWRSPHAIKRLGTVLILVGLGAACIGRRELFDLQADDPARSNRRFAAGAAEVEVTRFDPHPNALAHRLAGERLVEVLG